MVLAADRRHRILERVAEQQAIHVSDLAAELGVSEMTIRRDIRRLEHDGFLRQTYGGAIAHVTRSLELGFNARALQYASAKRLIAMEAAGLLGSASTMFVGIGTTAEQFALFLPKREGLTVITGSLPVATLLGTGPCEVVALGGTVRPDELSCYGPVALATAARYHADLTVLGAAGLSPRYGISELHDQEAELHRVMIEHSDGLMVLADGSKIGATQPALVGSAREIDILVTDESAPSDVLQELRALIPHVVVAARRETREERTS